MIAVYHMVTSLLAPFVVPVFSIIAQFSKYKGKGLASHFGGVPEVPNDGRPTLWLCALSSGELSSAIPVLKKIAGKRPDIRIIVSVTTDSGYEMARLKLDFVDRVFFHPIDCLPFTWLALQRTRPDLFVLMDTGFWPGFLHLLKVKGIPAVLLNGRMSSSSLRSYLKLRLLISPTLNSFKMLCMQNENGVTSMLKLGVQKEKLQQVGDLKFDSAERVSETERNRLRDIYKIRGDAIVWVAGSTHEGEEEIIAEVFQNLKQRFANLILILAPRRIERVDAVAKMLKRREIPFLLRSEFRRTGARSADVVLLDTYGELARVYGIAQVAFVGNSLIAPGGGHSLIEPAIQGIPVLHGPHVENFTDSAHALGKTQLTVEAKDGPELEEKLAVLLQNFGQLAKNAQHLLEPFMGASDRMSDLLLASLPQPSNGS
ncbi:MAG: hypothetical protein COV66_01940 [Nitrospinae bacterium CG11_big_fil_rev_8_21_14_0_20_45_15]|nr:MAG: hypothetical protein COV66_01940 [Nitrospinae bacterium CG11_big_fil_rev_8_21_14_0_20_45_15]